MTEIGIVGAGALGGLFAGRLAARGHRISVLARGATLSAIRRHGVRVQSGGQWTNAEVRSSDKAEELGVQEIVVVAVKAPSLAGVSAQISKLMNASTLVVPVLNGIPWWFGHGESAPPVWPRKTELERLLSVDIDTASVIGCVAYPSCSNPEPGVTVHASGNRIVLGEATGGDTVRAARLARIFNEAGFEAATTGDIRAEVWRKLLGNICFNPVSLLVGTTTDKLIDDPRTHTLFAAMMNEMLSLAKALFINVDVVAEERLALTRTLGSVKTSMLQDAEAGRPVEIEAIIGAVVGIAQAVKVDIPYIRAVHALAYQRADVLGILPR